MAISNTGRYSFGKSYSAWQVNEAWRARRREMARAYLNESNTAQLGLAAAWSNQIEGSAELAARAAITRIKAAAVARSADKTA